MNNIEQNRGSDMAVTASRGMFWLIWAMALVPLAIAMAAFFSDWRPADQVNYGQLYPAGTTLASMQLEQQLPPDGRWQLVLISPGHCDTACAEWQQRLPNLHAALGKERERLVLRQLSADQQRLALADPLGNLVLYYELTQSPQAILKDLKRLLKLSKVG